MQKNVIITGTSRGIGFELAKQFAENGHRVLALSRHTKPTKKLGKPNITTLPFDLTKEADHKMVADHISREWNTSDILIHNAGKFVKGKFESLTLSDFEEAYQTNVFGVVRLTQNLLPLMHQNSHVIAISTMGGIQGSVKFPGLTAYSSGKSAVINLMEVLAEEYKETGPVFNALALGAVETEMFKNAFPGAEAALKPPEMAEYIKQFTLTGHKVYNGKVLPVSNSTP